MDVITDPWPRNINSSQRWSYNMPITSNSATEGLLQNLYSNNNNLQMEAENGGWKTKQNKMVWNCSLVFESHIAYAYVYMRVYVYWQNCWYAGMYIHICISAERFFLYVQGNKEKVLRSIELFDTQEIINEHSRESKLPHAALQHLNSQQ